MIGLLLITHGELGETLAQCAGHMLNRQPPNLQRLGLHPHQDPAQLEPQAIAMIREIDDGSGVLVLTDMYGGSPSNLAAKLVVPGKVEVVAGISLPMLIRVLNYRDRDLQTIVTKAISGGCEGVMRVPALKKSNVAAGS